MPEPAIGPPSDCPWENPDGSTNVDGWLAAYADDDNTFWRTEQGHIMNVVDALIERLDEPPSESEDMVLGPEDYVPCPAKDRHEAAPLECRAKRWNGTPSYDGPHEWHFFTYGPNGIYTGSCSGR